MKDVNQTKKATGLTFYKSRIDVKGKKCQKNK